MDSVPEFGEAAVPVTPPPPPPRRPRDIIPFVLIGVAALMIGAALWVGRGDSTDASAASTVTTRTDAQEVPTSVASDDPAPSDTGAGDPAPEPGSDPATDPSGTEPAELDPWDAGLELDWNADTEQARATWAPATGGDHLTYRFEWASSDDTSGDFGDLPAAATQYEHDAPCGATIDFEILAWTASDQELGRASGSIVSDDCAPVVALPRDLVATETSTGVRFSWTPGTGYRAAYELTVTDATGGETDTGELGEVSSHEVNAFCATDITFTLLALDPSGSAELGRLSETFETNPCPGTFVVGGTRTEVAGGGHGNGTAICPPGSAVISGGFGSGINTALMPYPGWISRSSPTDTGWVVGLGSPPERGLYVFPRVLCMAHADTDLADSVVSVPSGSVRSIVASCPVGQTWYAAGGGFQVTPYGPKILVSAQDGPGSWRVTAFNENSTASELRAYVVCIRAIDAEVQVVRASVSIGDGSWGSRQLACPAGWTMLGGGWASPDAIVETAVHETAGSEIRWLVFGHNQQFAGPPGPTAVVEASVVCLHFR